MNQVIEEKAIGVGQPDDLPKYTDDELVGLWAKAMREAGWEPRVGTARITWESDADLGPWARIQGEVVVQQGRS